MIARLSIAIPHSKPFDYMVPLSLQPQIKLGMRVLVPFGPRFLVGVVVELGVESEFKKLKELKEIIDSEPLFDEKQLEFFSWVSRYYLCNLGLVLEAATPKGIKPKIQFHVTATEKLKDASWFERVKNKSLSPIELKTAQKLKKAGEVVIITTCKKPELLNSNFYSLVEGAGAGKKGSQKALVFGQLNGVSDLEESSLINIVSKATLSRLVREAYLVKEKKPLPPPLKEIREEPFLALNEEQVAAFAPVKKSLEAGEFTSFLLYGVTGSGKTEIYLHATKTALSQGKSVLILLPEISLTPQTAARFTERFGGRIAMLHSGLNDGDRASEWERILKGHADLVIGARSALFAPLKNVGLIIVDEEHDQSFKQQEAPHYNARDLSVKYAHDHKATVILGTATPSVESFYNVKQKKYQLLTLTKRASMQDLPPVAVINLKESPRQLGVFYLSTELYGELKSNFEAGKQAILFLNRRGYSNMLTCKNCNVPVLCNHCSITMTWHATKGALVCHSCGAKGYYPSACRECGHEKFQTDGIGTQRVERDLQKLFPKGKFLRMDRDTLSKKGELESKMALIHDNKVDFVIGTQLIAKGHDFLNVGLVGILMADMSINIPDFRSSERSYQLFSQVAGRAGRGGTGKAFIQSYNPNHRTIQAALTHDYEAYYDGEIVEREMLQKPPFERLILIKISHEKEQAAGIAAKELKDLLSPLAKTELVLGPIESAIFKQADRYYYQIIIQGKNLSHIKARLSNLLWGGAFTTTARITIDVDPAMI